MAKKQAMKKGENKRELPELSDLKAGKDGFKKITTTFDSEFYKFEKPGQTFVGRFAEIIKAGKKDEEKDCALFQEEKTNKSYLFGQKAVVDAAMKYGQHTYRLTFKGKTKVKGTSRTFNNIDVEVK